MTPWSPFVAGVVIVIDVEEPYNGPQEMGSTGGLPHVPDQTRVPNLVHQVRAELVDEMMDTLRKFHHEEVFRFFC
jgi:hypothetical protein